MSLGPCLLLLAAVALAWAVAAGEAERGASLRFRLGLGTCAGTAFLGLAGYALAAWRGGFDRVAVATAFAFALGPLLLLASAARRAGLMGCLRRAAGSWRGLPWAERAAGLASVLVGALVLRGLSRAVFSRPDGLYTGCDHNLGDLPFHLGVVSQLLHGGRFPPQHPELSGARLTYPFLVDVVPAQLAALGADLVSALTAQGLLLGLGLVLLLHDWACRLTGRRTAAAVVLALVFLGGGGVGFYHLVEELAGRGAPAPLGHDYTVGWDGEFRWANAVIALLLPQRALLLGLPLFLAATALLWSALDPEAEERAARRRLLAAGLVAGLMPLAHAHAFAVLLATSALLALLFPRWRAWAGFFAVALLLGLPQVAWLTVGGSLQGSRFLGFHLGWDHGKTQPLLFWLKNTGAFLPLLAVAYLWRGREAPVPDRLLRFSLPFLAWFLVPNVLRLSPWVWDNVKFLFFWYLASTTLVALVLVALVGRGWPGRLLSTALLLLLTLSGGLDVIRLARGDVAHPIFGAEALAFAEAVRRATPPDALVVHWPTHDHPVYLTGRRSYVGYAGHLWSQGLEAGTREEDVKRLYEGAGDGPAFLARIGATHVVVGPLEARAGGPWPPAIPGEVAATAGAYRLLALTRP